MSNTIYRRVAAAFLSCGLLLSGCAKPADTAAAPSTPTSSDSTVIEASQSLWQDTYYASTLSREATAQTVRVLLVRLDPVLNDGVIDGQSCAGRRASECLGHDADLAVNELITDISESSHGLVQIQLVGEDDANEFPTYTTEVQLLDGSVAHAYDESTWVDIMKNGWYNSLQDSRWDVGFHTFDYAHLLQTHDLVARRNANEFDMVWLVGVDPGSTDESMMVGSSPYYINGSNNIEADCDNFAIMNVSISRPDTNYECFGHCAENVLSAVFENEPFQSGFDTYVPDMITLDAESYAALNPWEKFILTDRAICNKQSGFAGVGNVHFAPNSTADYDWNNTTCFVTSKWQEWLDYPNMTNAPSDIVFDVGQAYENQPIVGTASDARRHHRWWFSLMPHVAGRTDEGWSNNWWDYLYTMDYVTQVTPQTPTLTLHTGDSSEAVRFDIVYNSGRVRCFVPDTVTNYLTISDETVVSLTEGGVVQALQPGSAEIVLHFDGQSATCYVQVS